MIYPILSHDAHAIWPEVSDYVTRALKLTLGQINADSVLERIKTQDMQSGTIHTWINGTKHATTISDSTDLDGFLTGRMGGSWDTYYMRVAEHRCTKAARYDTGGDIAVPSSPLPYP